MALKTDFDWDWGQLHVTVGVQHHSGGADCDVKVTTDIGSDTQPFFQAAPLQTTLAFDLAPPFTVTDLVVECTHNGGGGGPRNIHVDYLTVTNGDYQWPHPRDHEVLYDATSFPGGGYGGTVVRTDETGEYLLLATNTGGVAISDDGDDWWFLGGDDAVDRSQELIHTWEVWAPNAQTVYTIAGAEQSTYGGFLKWDATSDDWTVLDGELAVDDNDHICGDTHHAGGRLITSWNDGTDDVLFLANHGDTVKGGDTADVWDAPGVFPYDITTEAFCTADGLLDLPATGDDDLVSALEIVTVGVTEYLLVAYKSRASSADALWACPLDGDCSTGVTSACTAIASTGWDLRDLEVQEVSADERALVYAVDAGLRESGGSCTRDHEGTVMVLNLTEGDPGVLNASVWDSDTTYAAAWEVGVGKDGCPQHWDGDTAGPNLDDDYVEKVFEKNMLGDGELRIPESGASSSNELVGLAKGVGASDTFLFAFAKLFGTAYAYPKVHRAAITTPPSQNDLLPWKPLQDYWTGEPMYEENADLDTAIDTNYEERASKGDDNSSWLGSLHVQDDREQWFPKGPVDAVFYTMPDESVVAMVSGDIGVYGLPPESAAGAPGWDSIYSAKDMDEIPWFWAMDPISEVGQLVGRDLAYCSTCEPTSVDANGLAVVASMDVAMNWLYGQPDTGDRVAGKYDCHAENMTSGGRGVALVDDGAGGATVWVVRLQQSTGEPVRQNLLKGVLAAGDDFEDGDWCYETTSENKTTSNKSAFNGDDAICPRDDVLPGSYDWPACDPTNATNTPGELFDNHDGTNSFGSPTDVDVLHAEPDVAVVSFASYTGGATDYDGGLAVFYDDGGEMDVFQVPDFTGQASCSGLSMNDVFHHDGARVAIDQARSEWTSGTEFNLWIYVSAAQNGAAAGDDCAIYEVNATYSGGITATWTPVDIGSALGIGDCSDLTVDDVHGLATAPWAPSTVWVFGDTSGTGALCQIDVDSDVPANSTWTGLAPNNGKDRRVKRVRPHPHLEDTLLVGTSAPTTTNPNWQYEPSGLFQVAWRMNGVTGDVLPEWRPFPAEGLSNPHVNGIAFDVLETSEPYEVEAFWLSTSGSGVYEGLRQWDDN